MADVMKMDIYELFDIPLTADAKEIKSAYRKKALSCHPDKNPDNPKAAELFQQLSKALEVLTDSKAREAYDRVLRAKKAAALRNRDLDSKRKKLKEDLEAREKAALDEKFSQVDAAKSLQREIERLRKEGSKQVEEEQELLRQQIFREREYLHYSQKIENPLPRLKIKWSAQKEDNKNNYTEEELKSILEKHGHVTCFVISSKKKGTAIVEYAEIEAAKLAFRLETGKPENPLRWSWISGEPPADSKTDNVQQQKPTVTVPTFTNSSSTVTSRDYESLVLMKLRQAEERKRLIQQMKEDDS